MKRIVMRSLESAERNIIEIEARSAAPGNGLSKEANARWHTTGPRAALTERRL